MNDPLTRRIGLYVKCKFYVMKLFQGYVASVWNLAKFHVVWTNIKSKIKMDAILGNIEFKFLAYHCFKF